MARARRRGKPRAVPPHARGRVRRWCENVARENRYGQRQHQSARSGPVPHPQSAAPEHVPPLGDAGFETQVRRPRQIEFARGNLDYTVMSKRKLIALVQDGLVAGWDDPRMPTISGLRRRGFPPAAIRAFWERAGVTKQ